MKIEIGILDDGRITLVCDKPLPDIVKRVEYYREQRLVMLVYDDKAFHDQLMECELPEHMAAPIEQAPDVVIFTLFPGLEPVGYKAPLIKVGEIY